MKIGNLGYQEQSLVVLRHSKKYFKAAGNVLVVLFSYFLELLSHYLFWNKKGSFSNIYWRNHFFPAPVQL